MNHSLEAETPSARDLVAYQGRIPKAVLQFQQQRTDVSCSPQCPRISNLRESSPLSSSYSFSFCAGHRFLPCFLFRTSKSSRARPRASTSSLEQPPSGTAHRSLSRPAAPTPRPWLSFPPALGTFFAPPWPLPHPPRIGGKEKRRRTNAH